MSTTAEIVAVQQVMADYCSRLELDAFEEWLVLFTDDAHSKSWRIAHHRIEMCE